MNIYGTDETGFARSPWDNVGVQYGLAALQSGAITPEQFLDLNANVGLVEGVEGHGPGGLSVHLDCPAVCAVVGVDVWSARNMSLSPDGGATPAARREGNQEAGYAAYRSGMVFRGKLDIPVIDWRHYLEHRLDMHNSHQSFASRQRLLNYDGDASNQLIWFTDARPGTPQSDPTPQAFLVLDRWIKNIEANPEKSVGENKPADAKDACFATDGGADRERRRRLERDPRRQAGGCLHPAVPDPLDLADRRGRADRGRRLQVRAPAGGAGARAGPLRGVGADGGRGRPPEGDLPGGRVRLLEGRPDGAAGALRQRQRREEVGVRAGGGSGRRPPVPQPTFGPSSRKRVPVGSRTVARRP